MYDDGDDKLRGIRYLLPCHKCGSNAVLSVSRRGDPLWFFIECENGCGCTNSFENPLDAMHNWNARYYVGQRISDFLVPCPNCGSKVVRVTDKLRCECERCGRISTTEDRIDRKKKKYMDGTFPCLY